jgi:hypothetical protein
LRGWETRHILLVANAVSAPRCTPAGDRGGILRVQKAFGFLQARREEIPAGALGKETRR